MILHTNTLTRLANLSMMVVDESLTRDKDVVLDGGDINVSDDTVVTGALRLSDKLLSGGGAGFVTATSVSLVELSFTGLWNQIKNIIRIQ